MTALPRLHLVTDDEVLADGAFPDRARRALASGGDGVALHLRGPGTSGRRLFDLAAALLPSAERAGARLLVNDRVDVAGSAGVHGAHLGQRSLPPADARWLLGQDALLGLSVHGQDEAVAAAGQAQGVAGAPLDYLLVGTLFPTPSHPGRPGAGVERLARVRAVAPDLPLVGIGGITPDRVSSVLAAGGHGVAVLRGVWAAEDPARAVEAYRAALGEDRGGEGPAGGR